MEKMEDELKDDDKVKSCDREIKRYQKLYANQSRKEVIAQSSEVLEKEDEYPSAGEIEDAPLKWVEIDNIKLTQEDQHIVNSQHQWLNDKIVNAVPIMLERMYPSINGLQDTQKEKTLSFKICSPFVQILHSEGNHWITVACISPSYNIH